MEHLYKQKESENNRTFTNSSKTRGPVSAKYFSKSKPTENKNEELELRKKILERDVHKFKRPASAEPTGKGNSKPFSSPTRRTFRTPSPKLCEDRNNVNDKKPLLNDNFGGVNSFRSDRPASPSNPTKSSLQAKTRCSLEASLLSKKIHDFRFSDSSKTSSIKSPNTVKSSSPYSDKSWSPARQSRPLSQQSSRGPTTAIPSLPHSTGLEEVKSRPSTSGDYYSKTPQNCFENNPNLISTSIAENHKEITDKDSKMDANKPSFLSNGDSATQNSHPFNPFCSSIRKVERNLFRNKSKTGLKPSEPQKKILIKNRAEQLKRCLKTTNAQTQTEVCQADMFTQTCLEKEASQDLEINSVTIGPSIITKNNQLQLTDSNTQINEKSYFEKKQNLLILDNSSELDWKEQLENENEQKGSTNSDQRGKTEETLQPTLTNRQSNLSLINELDGENLVDCPDSVFIKNFNPSSPIFSFKCYSEQILDRQNSLTNVLKLHCQLVSSKSMNFGPIREKRNERIISFKPNKNRNTLVQETKIIESLRSFECRRKKSQLKINFQPSRQNDCNLVRNSKENFETSVISCLSQVAVPVTENLLLSSVTSKNSKDVRKFPTSTLKNLKGKVDSDTAERDIKLKLLNRLQNSEISSNVTVQSMTLKVSESKNKTVPNTQNEWESENHTHLDIREHSESFISIIEPLCTEPQVKQDAHSLKKEMFSQNPSTNNRFGLDHLCSKIINQEDEIVTENLLIKDDDFPPVPSPKYNIHKKPRVKRTGFRKTNLESSGEPESSLPSSPEGALEKQKKLTWSLTSPVKTNIPSRYKTFKESRKLNKQKLLEKLVYHCETDEPHVPDRDSETEYFDCDNREHSKSKDLVWDPKEYLIHSHEGTPLFDPYYDNSMLYQNLLGKDLYKMPFIGTPCHVSEQLRTCCCHRVKCPNFFPEVNPRARSQLHSPGSCKQEQKLSSKVEPKNFIQDALYNNICEGPWPYEDLYKGSILYQDLLQETSSKTPDISKLRGFQENKTCKGINNLDFVPNIPTAARHKKPGQRNKPDSRGEADNEPRDPYGTLSFKVNQTVRPKTALERKEEPLDRIITSNVNKRKSNISLKKINTDKVNEKIPLPRTGKGTWRENKLNVTESRLKKGCPEKFQIHPRDSRPGTRERVQRKKESYPEDRLCSSSDSWCSLDSF